MGVINSKNNKQPNLKSKFTVNKEVSQGKELKSNTKKHKNPNSSKDGFFDSQHVEASISPTYYYPSVEDENPIQRRRRIMAGDRRTCYIMKLENLRKAQIKRDSGKPLTPANGELHKTENYYSSTNVCRSTGSSDLRINHWKSDSVDNPDRCNCIKDMQIVKRDDIKGESCDFDDTCLITVMAAPDSFDCDSDVYQNCSFSEYTSKSDDFSLSYQNRDKLCNLGDIDKTPYTYDENGISNQQKKEIDFDKDSRKSKYLSLPLGLFTCNYDDRGSIGEMPVCHNEVVTFESDCTLSDSSSDEDSCSSKK